MINCFQQNNTKYLWQIIILSEKNIKFAVVTQTSEHGKG